MARVLAHGRLCDHAQAKVATRFLQRVCSSAYFEESSGTKRPACFEFGFHRASSNWSELHLIKDHESSRQITEDRTDGRFALQEPAIHAWVDHRKFGHAIDQLRRDRPRTLAQVPIAFNTLTLKSVDMGDIPDMLRDPLLRPLPPHRPPAPAPPSAPGSPPAPPNHPADLARLALACDAWSTSLQGPPVEIEQVVRALEILKLDLQSFLAAERSTLTLGLKSAVYDGFIPHHLMVALLHQHQPSLPTEPLRTVDTVQVDQGQVHSTPPPKPKPVWRFTPRGSSSHSKVIIG